MDPDKRCRWVWQLRMACVSVCYGQSPSWQARAFARQHLRMAGPRSRQAGYHAHAPGTNHMAAYTFVPTAAIFLRQAAFPHGWPPLAPY